MAWAACSRRQALAVGARAGSCRRHPRGAAVPQAAAAAAAAATATAAAVAAAMGGRARQQHPSHPHSPPATNNRLPQLRPLLTRKCTVTMMSNSPHPTSVSSYGGTWGQRGPGVGCTGEGLLGPASQQPGSRAMGRQLHRRQRLLLPAAERQSPEQRSSGAAAAAAKPHLHVALWVLERLVQHKRDLRRGGGGVYGWSQATPCSVVPAGSEVCQRHRMRSTAACRQHAQRRSISATADRCSPPS